MLGLAAFIKAVALCLHRFAMGGGLGDQCYHYPMQNVLQSNHPNSKVCAAQPGNPQTTEPNLHQGSQSGKRRQTARRPAFFEMMLRCEFHFDLEWSMWGISSTKDDLRPI